MTRAMTRTLRGVTLVLATGAVAMQASVEGVPTGTVVRIQGAPASELSPGWHPGTMLTNRQGCAMVATPDTAMPGGRRYLALLLVHKLERQRGGAWIDVPLKPLVDREPTSCRVPVGG